MCFLNLALLSSTGCPVNRAFWHLPQVGWSFNLSAGTRFTVSQCGQTICKGSSINSSQNIGDNLLIPCSTAKSFFTPPKKIGVACPTQVSSYVAPAGSSAAHRSKTLESLKV